MAARAAALSASAQRVLDAALDLFGGSGYSGTSLQQIADHLGVTKAAVYYHFRSKDELLAALVRPAVDDLQSMLETVSRLPRADDRREQGVQGIIEWLLRNRRLAGFLSRDVGALSLLGEWQVAEELGPRLRVLLLGEGPEDPLAWLWGRATLNALGGAALAGPDESDQWLRTELVELSRHLSAGYRRARRRAAAGP